MSGVPVASCRVAPQHPAKLVLIVDDDQSHLLFHSMLLQRFDYRVSAAKSVAEAVSVAEQTSPSLIIADLRLPRMGALDLLGRVRQYGHTSAVPIIALVEDGDQGAEERCLKAGFTACLRKPVGAEELYRAVQAAVEPAPRGNLRIKAKLPVSVNDAPLNSLDGEWASVISEHGMYIRTSKPHPRRAQLSIKIALNGRTVAADAVVLYSYHFGEGPFGEPGMGVKFVRMAPHDQEHLRSFIHGRVSGDSLSLP